MNKTHLYIATAVALVISTLFAGWYLYGPKAPKPETYAPAEVQADGSRILERKPTALKPKHQIPKGGKVERMVQVEIKPNQPPPSKEGVTLCPPVQVDMSIVRMPDESRRVVASSPNGEVISGVDIPVEPVRSQRIPVWAAGIMVNPIDKRYGAFVDRDLGPFRLGAEVIQSKEDAIELWVKGGWRF